MESTHYSPFGYFLKALKQYFDFSSRARRKEYWFFILFYVIFYLIAATIDVVLLQSDPQSGVGIVTLIFSLAVFFPSLAVNVRRLHDTGRSGWWLLLSFIPLAGIIILVFLCQDSTEDNNYGTNLKLAES